MMNNEPRANQSLAITVAMVAVSLGAVLVSVVTAWLMSPLLSSTASAEQVTDLQGGLAVTWLGWLILMFVLAVVRGRRPDPDRYSRPVPPLGLLLGAAVGGAAIGMTGFSGGPLYGAVFGGVGITCWVWTACVVLLSEEPAGKEDVAP